jgi:integrase
MSEELRDLQRQIARISGSLDKMAGDRPRVLFRDFAAAYNATKQQDPTLSFATKRLFAHQTLNVLIPAFGHLALEEITNPAFLTWVSATRESKARMTRFFNARKCLVELLRQAKEAGHIEKLPKLPNPDAPKDVGRVLEQKEIIAILWRSRRPFRFIFYTFWKMGCRPREILQYEYAMLRQEKAALWIDIPARISKNRRFRSIPIPNAVSKRLLKRKGWTNSQFIFPSTMDKSKPQLSYASAWNLACEKAGIQKKATPYDFRRTWITTRAIENKPLMDIALYLDTSVGMIQKTYYKSQANVMEGLVSE